MSPDGPSSGACRMIEASSGFHPHAIIGSISPSSARTRIDAGEHAGVVHVDVRIGLVAGDHRRVVDEFARQVGVVVERDRDRHARGRCGAPGATISPSGSSQSSITIAPCRSRNTASHPARTASSIGRTSVSNVARDALFDGHDSAATGVTISARSFAAMSRYAASGVLVPRKRAPPPRRTRARRRGRTTTAASGSARTCWSRA